MPETLDHHWLTSQLQSMHCSQLAHSEKLGRLAGEISSLRQTVAGELKASQELVHRLLDHMSHRGPTPSPGSTTPPPSPSPTPPPTPGTPSLWTILTKLAEDLGGLVHISTMVVSFIRYTWLIVPFMWLTMKAAWAWGWPLLLRLLSGF